MNFGCSVGDFVAIGNLAWSVYKSCKGHQKASKTSPWKSYLYMRCLKKPRRTFSHSNFRRRDKPVWNRSGLAVIVFLKTCREVSGAQVRQRVRDRSKFGAGPTHFV